MTTPASDLDIDSIGKSDRKAPRAGGIRAASMDLIAPAVEAFAS
jgi:hypothetical protein